MKTIFHTLLALMLFSSIQAHPNHSGAAAVVAEVKKASEAFNTAYETNDVETYFDLYTDDAMLYFYGERWEVSNYYEYWKNMIAAGGGVEKNRISDIQIQVIPGGNTAITGAFIENRSRSPEGVINEEKGYETELWQKIHGKWKIISLHYSVIPETE